MVFVFTNWPTTYILLLCVFVYGNAGAATGHACSANTLINLARMGNRYVQEHYDLPTIRQAAINVTRIVTG